MKANWSLVLNVVLLFGVLFAIIRLIILRKKEISRQAKINIVDPYTDSSDDIISVRKLDSSDNLDELGFKLSPADKATSREISQDIKCDQTIASKVVDVKDEFHTDQNKIIMIFLSAKDDREFAGYDLLQSLLAAGLRFGEGNIFHKYQKANGQGAVLFSLAAATNSGTFDLQTMGSCRMRGLCMYMYLSGNQNVDLERFNLMYSTSQALAEDLDANLLDDKQKILSATSIDNYHKYINLEEAVL